MSFTSAQATSLATELHTQVTTKLTTVGLTKDEAIAAAAYGKLIADLGPDGAGATTITLDFTAATRTLDVSGQTVELPEATANVPGLLPAADKGKLNLITISSAINMDEVALKISGIPSGGTTGQILSKTSNTNYDTQWQDAPVSGVSSVGGNTGVVTGEQLVDAIDTFLGGSAWRDGSPIASTPNAFSSEQTSLFTQLAGF